MWASTCDHILHPITHRRTRWFVSSTIVGAQTLEQLVEDLDAWRGPPGLPQEVLDAIQEVRGEVTHGHL
jgi:aryl-alcohol dehydrogenase-like predicted oxidoreductase